jgi:ATP-dependent DNA helicase PIF1
VPRVTLTTDDAFPFVLRRRQFPIRPAFAMTINKSQGQTLKRVGVYLPAPVFSHGQLYVAMSRVGDRDDIVFCIVPVTKATVLAEDNRPGHYTRNVVYTNILR